MAKRDIPKLRQVAQAPCYPLTMLAPPCYSSFRQRQNSGLPSEWPPNLNPTGFQSGLPTHTPTEAAAALGLLFFICKQRGQTFLGPR